MIRLVASDLDFTLMNDSREISDYTKGVLSKIMKKGIHFIPCSAREWIEIPTWLKENKNIPFIICENGAVIMDNRTEKSLIEHKMPKTKVLELMGTLKGINEYWTIMIDGVYYSSKKILEDAKKLDIFSGYLHHILEKRVLLDDYVELVEKNDGLTKIHYMTPTLELKKRTQDSLVKIPDITLVSSHIKNIEITNSASTKGQALAYVGGLLDVSASEMLAFGDNVNDLSMLEFAKYAFVPANAEIELKEKITTLPWSNDEDGIARKIVEMV